MAEQQKPESPNVRENVTRTSKEVAPLLLGLRKDLENELYFWEAEMTRTKQAFEKAEEQVEIRHTLIKKLQTLEAGT